MTSSGRAAEREAKKLGVPFLGAIPLDPEMRRWDEATPFIIRRAKDNPPGRASDAIMEAL